MPLHSPCVFEKKEGRATAAAALPVVTDDNSFLRQRRRRDLGEQGMMIGPSPSTTNNKIDGDQTEGSTPETGGYSPGPPTGDVPSQNQPVSTLPAPVN